MNAPENDLARTRARRVVVTDEGPVLVEGPVEVVLDDGTRVRSDRGVVALCTCRRSRTAPFCDTSHRTKVRAERPERREASELPDAPERSDSAPEARSPEHGVPA